MTAIETSHGITQRSVMDSAWIDTGQHGSQAVTSLPTRLHQYCVVDLPPDLFRISLYLCGIYAAVPMGSDGASLLLPDITRPYMRTVPLTSVHRLILQIPCRGYHHQCFRITAFVSRTQASIRFGDYHAIGLAPSLTSNDIFEALGSVPVILMWSSLPVDA
jgi:hypothetical protein